MATEPRWDQSVRFHMMEKAAAVPQVLPALLVKVQLTDLDWTLFTGQKCQL